MLLNLGINESKELHPMTEKTATPESTVSTVSVDALFEPFEFGQVTLKNRIAMAPMTRSQSPGHIPGPNVAEYYRRRAAGGVALIITEGVSPPHEGAASFPNIPGFDGDEILAGWKEVVKVVHGEGSHIIPQLWHVGGMRQPGKKPNNSAPGYGPSAVIHPGVMSKDPQPPVEMTHADIREVVQAFACCAKNAEAIGCDGVEIHGAHSYLVDQFFWEHTNQRTDGYGGKTLAGRTRFAVEIIEAIRDAVSPEFPVVFRFSQWKQGEYDHKMAKNPQELEAFLTPLLEAGVDYFHASQRRFGEAEFEGSNLNLAGWAQKISGKPAITVGSVGLNSDFLRTYAGKEAGQAGLDALMERLEAREFDLVAVGRALLSDADWANKVRDGRENEIVAFRREHMDIFE